MKNNKILVLICLVMMLVSCGNGSTSMPKLRVVGTQLMNEFGDTVVLKGVSFGWHQFWPRFYTDSTVQYLAKNWKAEVVRASMGVDLDSACYVYQPAFGVEKVTTVVDAAIKNNLYAIIDWHSHHLRVDESKAFFTDMATRYKGIPNVIYEIYNEPVEDTWEEVKAYSEEIIRTIRAIEPEAVILVGCPHWDQDIHLAAADPIQGYDNIMYTVHFYAATHGEWLRQRTDEAMAKGLPIFISECAGMEASGDGPIDEAAWNDWLRWMQQRSLSWVAWSVSDKDETCSMLLPSAASTGYWADDDIKEWGKMVRNQLRNN